jgi:hypothetical protein
VFGIRLLAGIDNHVTNLNIGRLFQRQVISGSSSLGQQSSSQKACPAGGKAA